MVNTVDKDRAAQRLAQAHYRVEPDLIQIIRVRGSVDLECQPLEPIKLLEVNSATIPSGILPIEFGPYPEHGIDFPSVIIEVTPKEFELIQQKSLRLPNGWSPSEELPRESDDAEQ